jgi:deoxyribodipyrimidine photo-lyase
VVRSGDVVGEVCKVAAETDAAEVHMAADVSGYAQRREQRLRRALEAEGRRLHVHDTVTTAVAPGAVTPHGQEPCPTRAPPAAPQPSARRTG